MKYLYLLLLLNLNCAIATSQKIAKHPAPNQASAEAFIAQLSSILNEKRVDDFIPELVITKPELTTFLESEWVRIFNPRHRKKIRSKLAKSLYECWHHIQREDGYYTTQGFISTVSQVTKEKAITKSMVNSKWSDISVATAEEFNTTYGEISRYKIHLISAKYMTNPEPDVIYEIQMWLPVVLTEAGQYKLVAHTKIEYLSNTLK